MFAIIALDSFGPCHTLLDGAGRKSTASSRQIGRSVRCSHCPPAQSSPWIRSQRPEDGVTVPLQHHHSVNNVDNVGLCLCPNWLSARLKASARGFFHSYGAVQINPIPTQKILPPATDDATANPVPRSDTAFVCEFLRVDANANLLDRSSSESNGAREIEYRGRLSTVDLALPPRYRRAEDFA